jgi:hypothetical protein
MSKAAIIAGISIVLLIYGSLSYYTGARIFQWLRLLFPHLNGPIYAVLYGVCALSIVMMFLPLPAGVKGAVSGFGAYWMGMFVYLLLFFLAADLLFLIGSLVKLIPAPLPQGIRFFAGLTVIVLTIGFVSYGIYNANQLKHVSYTVQTKETKRPADMHIVLISDLHLGAVHSERRLARIVEQINALEPDLVCIVGDIFNDDYHAIRDPDRAAELFRQIDAAYGVYASLGNHDSGGTFDEMLAFLERSNIRLLKDEYVVIDERLALFGRVDPSPIGGFGGLERQGISHLVDALDPNLPIVVMDHTPINLDQYDERFDLVLAGHTHKGQIFPANLITDAIYEVDYGHYQRDASAPHVIVTSGAGIWGMPMRVGSNCEIVSIRLQ